MDRIYLFFYGDLFKEYLFCGKVYGRILIFNHCKNKRRQIIIK